MKTNDDGFTLFEVVGFTLWLSSVGIGLYLIYLVISALQKYIAS